VKVYEISANQRRAHPLPVLKQPRPQEAGRAAAESALVRGLSDAEKPPISQFAGPSMVAQVFEEHAPASLVDATIGIRYTAGIVAGSLLIGPGGCCCRSWYLRSCTVTVQFLECAGCVLCV
jgi:hypothetical protein